MSDWQPMVDPILRAAAKKIPDPGLAERFASLPIPRLVASLPFISGCPKPEKLSKKNIDTLIKGLKKPSGFAHRPGMSLRKRLAPGDNFKGAKNPDAAEKGMLLLELASLQDHQRDRERDKAAGKPNPLNEGMDYQKERDRLLKAIAAIQSPEIDGILTAETLTKPLRLTGEQAPWVD